MHIISEELVGCYEYGIHWILMKTKKKKKYMIMLGGQSRIYNF